MRIRSDAAPLCVRWLSRADALSRRVRRQVAYTAELVNHETAWRTGWRIYTVKTTARENSASSSHLLFPDARSDNILHVTCAAYETTWVTDYSNVRRDRRP